jgi:hypothetical protein
VAGVLLLRFRRQSEPGQRPPQATQPGQQLAEAEELAVLGQPMG